MQGNTTVLVSAADHPRTGTAGRVVSPAPYVPTAPNAAHLAALKLQADAMEQARQVAHAAAIEATDEVQRLNASAADARAALAGAIEAAGPDGAPLPLCVDVAFDTDGAVEAVPVEALRQLG